MKISAIVFDACHTLFDTERASGLDHCVFDRTMSPKKHFRSKTKRLGDKPFHP